MKKLYVSLTISLLAILQIVAADHSQVKLYNVVWDSPSVDANGSMPLGNGDIGLNVWTEKNGNIYFYISKTDSWSDNGRLLKVGKVCINTSPAIRFDQGEFKQELDLKSGMIIISAKGVEKGVPVNVTFRIWVDANDPVIQVATECTKAIKTTARMELWRTEPRKLAKTVFSDLYCSPDDFQKPMKQVIVEPDIVIDGKSNFIGWYHFNKKSEGFDFVNELQGLSGHKMEDPFLHRTFGAIISGSDVVRLSNTEIETKTLKKNLLSIYVLTQHPSSPEKWLSSVEETKRNTEKVPFDQRLAAHKKWWNDFWDRSWINASIAHPGDSATNDPFIVSRGYTLQRFINACGGRGTYPIKFNGSIFTVPPFDREGDADFRWWGPGYWWQNTRLPYIGMCNSGDFDMMHALFENYAGNIYQLSKYRTKHNFGIDGVYFPECMYFWGAQFAIDYGLTPWTERPDKLQDSRYHKWEWVAGPELVFMMLDYYDYTGDEKILKDKIIPVANDIFRFFENYYKTNDAGKLVMYPSQSAETWWDCTNPMPELSGLHAVVKRLLALPKDMTGDDNRKWWQSFQSKLPEIPVRKSESGMALAPAERFDMKRNVENPELYAVFPFRLYGVGRPDIQLAENALKHRGDKGFFGWRQDELFMAYLGLTDEAKAGLVGRAKNSHKQSRFPAFWGPNYDWVPDQDHGGILMKTFQSMLMQADPYSNKIYMFPAWPKEWNVDFKLHAPGNTTVEGVLKDGKLKELKVFPESRRNDLEIMNGIRF